jgi:hypothetical protein
MVTRMEYPMCWSEVKRVSVYSDSLRDEEAGA